MKKQLFCFICLCIPLFCMAQVFELYRYYEYDAAGNRTLRKVIDMKPPDQMPPAPQDSLYVTIDNVTRDEIFEPNNAIPHTADRIPQSPDFYTETIARTEIKIYPNPTTEKITLEIAGWETLQKGVFTLFTLNGQLLQEHPVHSATTEVSLTGLARGTYILKVQINDRVEDWKVIKN